MDFTSLFSIALGAILVNNFIFSQFLGICPFMGVSKKVDTALGMGMAVIFVMGVASAVCWPINKYLLVANGLDFMQTVTYILVIASLVQFVEMFLQKAMPSLYQALGVRPGSISPLGLVFDENHEIHLIVDEDVAALSAFCVHPCRNTESLVISQEGFQEYLKHTGHTPQYIQITGEVPEKE